MVIQDINYISSCGVKKFKKYTLYKLNRFMMICAVKTTGHISTTLRTKNVYK